jgi:hypothetical protein
LQQQVIRRLLEQVKHLEPLVRVMEQLPVRLRLI